MNPDGQCSHFGLVIPLPKENCAMYSHPGARNPQDSGTHQVTQRKPPGSPKQPTRKPQTFPSESLAYVRIRRSMGAFGAACCQDGRAYYLQTPVLRYEEMTKVRVLPPPVSGVLIFPSFLVVLAW